jgi:hypothetical protein
MHHHHWGGWGWGGPVFFRPFGFGLGGGLFGDLLAGGLGYMLGRWQGTRNQPYPPYTAYPYGPYQYQTPPAQSNPADARLAQLQLLARLRDSGVLTEAEFEAEKQRILQGL